MRLMKSTYTATSTLMATYPSVSNSRTFVAPTSTNVRPVGAEPVAPGDIATDNELVPGLRLPSIPGLPGSGTPGWSLDDLIGPPADGSAKAKADLAVVKGAQLLRTKDGIAWARRMDAEGTTKMWMDLARRHRERTGKVQGWLDTALVASVLAANGAMTVVGKKKFNRPRPFVVDPKITVALGRTPHATTSYPSGHSSSAFAGARVIARLAPELADEAYSLAKQVAVSRVYAGVHFPSDIVAGAMLGTGVAESVLKIGGRATFDAISAVAAVMTA